MTNINFADNIISSQMLCKEILSKKFYNNDTLKFIHYTNAETAYKIIKNEELWMRNVSCMNDYKEVVLGKELLFDVFKDKKICKEFNTILQSINKTLNIEDILQQFKDITSDIEKRTYIACVSVHAPTEDEFGRLSMWRAYGQQKGVGIVIDKSYLTVPLATESEFLLQVPCLYKTNLTEQIRFILDTLKTTFSPLSPEIIRDNIIFAFFIIILSTKHAGFEEEQEWRFILAFFDKNAEDTCSSPLLTKQVEFINTIPQIIYKLNLKNINYNAPPSAVSSFLKKIIIGPTEYPEIIKESFCDLLKRKGIDNPEECIQISNIPLRT